MNLSFDKDQLKAISSIAADAGQVFFAATVVPFMFGNCPRFDKTFIVRGCKPRTKTIENFSLTLEE